MGVLKDEVDEIGSLLMANRIEDGLQGEATMWKFVQSVSAIGRDKSPLRNREIQDIAGKLLENIWEN
jgi:hypothetical protein